MINCTIKKFLIISKSRTVGTVGGKFFCVLCKARGQYGGLWWLWCGFDYIHLYISVRARVGVFGSR